MSLRWLFPVSLFAWIAIGIAACNINPQPLPPGDDPSPTGSKGTERGDDDDNGEAKSTDGDDDDSTDSPSAGAANDDAGAAEGGTRRDGGDGGK